VIPPIRPGDLFIKLEPVADGLTAPNWGTAAPGLRSHLFVTDQIGIIWAIDLHGEKCDHKAKSKGNRAFIFLDARHLLVPLGSAGPHTYDERGLLGVAFHPQYQRNGLLYTFTSEPAGDTIDFSTMPAGVIPGHANVIREWQARNPRNPRAGVFTRKGRVLMRVAQPQFNHNGGALNFGPDGMLYISLGDGGFEDDQGLGHGKNGNGQNPTNPLGSVLRIDLLGANSSNGRYGVPADNPFVEDPAKLDEIFAYGFRNPFRFSFDQPTGLLYLADVGQHDVEEVDVVVAGGNYGWNRKEGSYFFHPEGVNEPGHASQEPDHDRRPRGDLIDPIAEYEGHTDGHAIIGGFVYRGSQIPELIGRYVFGDFSSEINETSTEFAAGRLFYLDAEHLDGDPDGDGHPNESPAVTGTNEISEFQVAGHEEGASGQEHDHHHGSLGINLLGMGRDARGELYALGNTTGIPFGTTRVVLKIVKAEGDVQEHHGCE
jgi:glucose/arabinose dehydrogenase